MRGVSASRWRSVLFDGIAVLSLALCLTFLTLPLVAVFLRIPVGELIRQMASDVAVDALLVTAKTSAISQLIIVGIGTPAAYVLAMAAFRGRSFLVTLIELPLVLPPAVAGIALLVAFGRLGLLGGTLSRLGVEVGFTQAAVVMAVVFVAGPFYVRQAIAAFQGVDSDLLAASRTLGAGSAPCPSPREALQLALLFRSPAEWASSEPPSSSQGAFLASRRRSPSPSTPSST